MAHLVLEEAGQQEALRAGHFHRFGVMDERRISHEVIEDDAQVLGSRPFAGGPSGDLRIVREHTCVVEEFPLIDRRFRDILKPKDEELQHAPMVNREQFR